MSESPVALPDDLEPDLSHVTIEDGLPVDNLHSEREQRLLVDTLYHSWRPGRPFVAMANVGLFFKAEDTNYVPDVLVSLDVELPAEDHHLKKNRSYFTWVYGKQPDLVVEIVSNRDRHEERKIEGYARHGIAYYAIHDPQRLLSKRELRVFELHGNRYVEYLDPRWIPQLGLGMKLWRGVFQGWEDSYLRWCDEAGNLLECGEELGKRAVESVQQARGEAEQARGEAEQARGEAEQAREEAEHAREEAQESRARAEQAERQLRELQQRLRQLEGG